MTTPYASRRIVFHGLGALGVAATLAACGGGDGDGDAADPTTPATSGTPTDQATERDSASPSDSGTPEAEGLVATSEVPVGGGVILLDEHLVITQPTAGEFAAFGSRCKHQGFDVGKVEDGTITCLRHGSMYDAATGDVTGGPAPTGLDKVEIKVQGGNIVLA